MYTVDVKVIIKGNVEEFAREIGITEDAGFSLGKLENLLDIKKEEKSYDKSKSEISINFLCENNALFQNIEKIHQLTIRYNLKAEFYYREFIYPQTIIINEVVDVKNRIVKPHIDIEEFVEILYRADRDTIEDVGLTIDSIFKKMCKEVAEW